MYITQNLGRNDCVLISLANYTGKDYNMILKIANDLGLKESYIIRFGIPQDLTPSIIRVLIGKLPRVFTVLPEVTFSGLASWKKPHSHSGHMTCMVDGNVFDTDGAIRSREDYQTYYGVVLKRAYYLD